jgi:hypothetical protein
MLVSTNKEQGEWLEQAKDTYKGEQCFLLGCGKSLNQIDLSKLRGEIIMGVNGTYLIESIELDFFVTVSHIFWKHHIEGLKNYCCKKRLFLPKYITLELDCPTTWLNTDVHQDFPKPLLFSLSADKYVVLGGTVIGVGLQILYHLGFSKVILLGIDHDYGLQKENVGERGSLIPSESLDAHFIPNYYPKGGKVHIDIFGAERAYTLANTAFKNDGRTIVNASPNTKLDIFPVVYFDSLFAYNKSSSVLII